VTEIRLDGSDIRVAAALLLGCAAARAALPGEPGLPCGLRALTGIPCPLCGMTTSVTDAVQLDLGGAVAANPGGVALVVLAIAIVLGPARRLAVRPGLLYCALAVTWLWELHRFDVV
jgi:Protein of unknown function (DUF2752)